MNDVKATFYKTLNEIVGEDRIDNQEAYIINDYIGRLEATIKDEQQEIKRLNMIIDIKNKRIDELNKRLDKKGKKLDKAIEYIKVLDKNEIETIDDVAVLDNYLSDLLDILRGEDNGR